jgi:hypothetical protein
MRRLLSGLLLVGASALGCASSQRVEESAIRHEQRAVELEARGDYHGAAEQRAAAEKQRAKAAERARDEERWMR